MMENTSPNILECQGLTKHYGGFAAVRDLDITLPRGKIIGLLGPNGSGKTTLLKMAAGLLRPSRGRVLIDGKEPGPETKAVVSFLPERTYLSPWMTAKDCMDFFADFYTDFERSRAEEMLHRLGVPENAPIRTLSKGTREKVQLILVMSRRAQLYLLDEPTGGVDPASREFILNTIIANYDSEATVLISTHLIADVENILDEFLFLKEGRVVTYASTEGLRADMGKSVDEYFREVFRC